MDMIKIHLDVCGSLIHLIMIRKTEKQLLPTRVCSQIKK